MSEPLRVLPRCAAVGRTENPSVLLTREHELGVAAVCRAAAGSLWVTADLERWSTSERPEDSGMEFDDDGPTYDIFHSVEALAGRLPDGATSAYVRDVLGEYHPAAVGSGFWLAAIERSVRFRALTRLFRDGDGRIVPPPQPAGAERRPIDAQERCPACDGEEWDYVSRPRGSGPPEATVCRACGYEVFAPPAPSWLPDELPEAPRWLRRVGTVVGEALVAGVRAWTRRQLRAAESPLYGLGPGWTSERFLVGAGSALGRDPSPYVFELGHGAPPGEGPFVGVETVARQDDDRESLTPPQRAEESLIAVLEDLVPASHDASQGHTEAEALRLQLLEDERERELARRVLKANRERVEIPVDGRGIEFTALHDPDLWVATAQLGEVDVSIRGYEIPLRSIELARIEDPSGYA